jgi:hypothetical protein
MSFPSFPIIKSNKGVSLPLITGLLTILMIGSVAASDLVVRSLRSVRGVEWSAKAYFAAEAGMENALYELSPHKAGYQTPSLVKDDEILGGPERKSAFNNNNKWLNQWSILSRSKEIDPNTNSFFYKGHFSKGEKMTVSLFVDDAFNENIETNGIANSAPQVKNIMVGDTPLGPNDPIATFWMPKNIMDLAYTEAYGNYPIFDFDGDGSYNEDRPDITSDCRENPMDNDCDGLVDEDNEFKAVILWRLFDDSGHSLIPIQGCIQPYGAGSELCELAFNSNLDNSVPDPIPYSVTLKGSTMGMSEDGVTPKSISNFINENKDPANKIQFEFLILVPMEFVSNSSSNDKFAFPYFEYKVQTKTIIPPALPQFTIQSDGYYSTYKQSIRATITPKTTIPLYDFTIIQQK